MTQFDPSMVAQMLMQPVGKESLDNSIAEENFFEPVEIPTQGMVAPLDMQGGFFKGFDTDNQDMTVEPGMLLPFERTAEGRLQFATPQLVAGILEGLQQAGQTIHKGVSGDPMFVPVDGKLSEQAIDEITNLGLTMGGTAYTGSSLIPGLVPEGVLASTLKGAKKTTDVSSDASKIDLPTDSSKVKNKKMLDKPKNPKNLLKYKGKETWGVIVDNLDNEVIGTVPFEKAQAADFHHSFYMSPKFIKKIDDGDYSLYVDNDDGFGLIEGKGKEVPPAVKKRILEQVEYFSKDD